MDIPKPKCYLVATEMPYEGHDFTHAKVFYNEKDAEEYKEELSKMEAWGVDNTEGVYGYLKIIELDLILKH